MAAAGERMDGWTGGRRTGWRRRARVLAVAAVAVITISWNSVSRNLHVNSFYLELAEVISARLLLLRRFVTVAQQDRYFHGGGYWLLLRAPA